MSCDTAITNSMYTLQKSLRIFTGTMRQELIIAHARNISFKYARNLNIKSNYLFKGISESLSLLLRNSLMSKLNNSFRTIKIGASFWAATDAGSTIASIWKAGPSVSPGIFTTLSSKFGKCI